MRPAALLEVQPRSGNGIKNIKRVKHSPNCRREKPQNVFRGLKLSLWGIISFKVVERRFPGIRGRIINSTLCKLHKVPIYIPPGSHIDTELSVCLLGRVPYGQVTTIIIISIIIILLSWISELPIPFFCSLIYRNRLSIISAKGFQGLRPPPPVHLRSVEKHWGDRPLLQTIANKVLWS